MAFFATRPTSMMMPMKLIRLSVERAASNASTTPIRLSGSEIITGSGAVNEPNWITSTMYINSTPLKSATPMSPNTCCWSFDAPANSRP